MDFLNEFKAALDSVPAWNWGLQAVGLLTSYIGAELNARMRVSGFYVWIVSNFALGILHAVSSLWLLLLLDALFFKVNVQGVLTWSKKHPDQMPRWLARWVQPLSPTHDT